ncbi:hypothetical protein GGI12_002597 [Dipsacomyces acuminosporus]|nr:hypothetical protein GGI12_002597 [Dipsacomyces acuminosporus]
MADDGSERWEFVYMRNVDISRMSGDAIREIWHSVGVESQNIACATSIGAFLAEFVVRKRYSSTFARILSSITQPSSPNAPQSTLSICVDQEYSPLAPYSHTIPPKCNIPERAQDALEQYARESLKRRWSNLYHSANRPDVREFLLRSLDKYSLDLLPSLPVTPSKLSSSRKMAKAAAANTSPHSGSDLVHHRTSNHSILSVDHLAELIPRPSSQRLIVYADGAYLPERGAAGIGVYFENMDVPPVAERLRGHQSNARAEIYAMVTALDRLSAALQQREKAKSSSKLEIWVCSDSRYAVDGINIYLESWEQTDWLTAKGKPVANRTAFRHLHSSIQMLSERGHTLFIHHLPSHSGIRGNEVADMLAKAGALL